MSLALAAVVPHGWLLIDALDPTLGGAQQTRDALLTVRSRTQELGVEVVVIITPHGIRVDGAIAVAGTARAAGTLRHHDKLVEANVPLDPRLTTAVVQAATQATIPVATVGFAGNQLEESTVPLDWGTMVPLWFLGHDGNPIGRGDVLADPPEADLGPPAVIVSPSRALPRQTLIDFGAALADAIAADDRAIAVIASCDWSHTHAGGRYGEDDAASKVDAAVVAALDAADPGRLLSLTEEAVKAAAIDGLWQALVLAGIFARQPMRGGVLSYEAPPVYATGMVVAAYEPNSPTTS